MLRMYITVCANTCVFMTQVYTCETWTFFLSSTVGMLRVDIAVCVLARARGRMRDTDMLFTSTVVYTLLDCTVVYTLLDCTVVYTLLDCTVVYTLLDCTVVREKYHRHVGCQYCVQKSSLRRVDSVK